MNIFHVSDLHYPFQNDKGVKNLQKIIENIKSQDIRPDVVLVTGDLVNGDYNDYPKILEILKTLPSPFLCITGNKDNSVELMKALQKFVPSHPASEHKTKLDYVVDAYPLKIIALDSCKENTPGGEISIEQFAWLEEQLKDGLPSLVMVHQFTINAGFDFFDVKTRQPWTDKFNEVIARHKEAVKLVICGHLHNSVISNIAGVPIISTFSTNWEAHLAFEPTEHVMELNRPVGYYIHRWNGQQIVSYAIAL